MPEVCVSRNLDVTASKLGLEPWSAPRMVKQVSANSTADGSISSSGLTQQPGRLLISTSLSWTSDSPITLKLRLQVIRAYRTITASNPNAVQIWDSWNTGINKTPRTPDSYNLVNSLCTLAMDVGTDTTSQPYYARLYEDFPATASEEWFDLPAAAVFNVLYRCYVWTPPPWSNNASGNSPVHEAYARSVKLRLWAFPTADSEVRS